jgi:uncharacterized protein YdcH (DUF465 family)
MQLLPYKQLAGKREAEATLTKLFEQYQQLKSVIVRHSNTITSLCSQMHTESMNLRDCKQKRIQLSDQAKDITKKVTYYTALLCHHLAVQSMFASSLHCNRSKISKLSSQLNLRLLVLEQ